MERTKESTSRGKWFFVISKENTLEAVFFLDKELQLLYQSVVTNKLRFNHVPIPQRVQTKGTQAVGSYASVIMGMISNPQEEYTEEIKYNKSTTRHCKQQALTLGTATGRCGKLDMQCKLVKKI
eukprot:2250750-Ditylum_brightwellii.AAC.1